MPPKIDAQRLTIISLALKSEMVFTMIATKIRTWKISFLGSVLFLVKDTCNKPHTTF